MANKKEKNKINEKEVETVEIEEATKIDSKKVTFNWNTEKIMSTSALFISVISLIALLYQSYLSREENKLIQKQQSASVLPYLNQWLSEYNNQFKIIMGNKGVGPAFITNVEITLNSTKTFNNSDALFRELFSTESSLDTIPFVTSTLIKGFVLPANETINLVEIEGQENIDTFKKIMLNSNISFSITYKDVYGSHWLLTNHNDSGNSAQAPILLDQK